MGVSPPAESPEDEDESSQPNIDLQETEEVTRSLTAQPEPEEHATPPPDTISTASPTIEPLNDSQPEEDIVEEVIAEETEELAAELASPEPEVPEPLAEPQREEEEEEAPEPEEEEEPVIVEESSPKASQEVEDEPSPTKAESPTTAQEPEIPDAGEEEDAPTPTQEVDVIMDATVASPEAEIDVEVDAEPQEPMGVEAPRESEQRILLSIDLVLTDGIIDKRKPSETSQLGARKRAREDSEPTEEDAQSTFFIPFSLLILYLKLIATSSGPSQTIKQRRKSTHTETPIVSKKFQNVIGMLHSTISQHRYGNIFHNPIKKTEAPDYHDIVKRPMDLKTIKSRVKDGWITNSSEFQRDVYLMFANAMMYNRPGSEIYNMAEEMMLESETHITTFRQTEGFHRM